MAVTGGSLLGWLETLCSLIVVVATQVFTTVKNCALAD